MAAEVTALQPIKHPSTEFTVTPEQKYWRSFTSQLLLPSPHSSPITSIAFPPPSSTPISSALEAFVVTSGTRLQLYSTRTRKLLKTISRFGVSDTAHSGRIRRDGRVVVAGGDSGAIQAFDVNSRAILRTWNEHKQPVWVTEWHPSELTTLMSASDDTTVRLWDLPSDDSTRKFVGHQDYVRSGCFMIGQANGMVVTGSYDQTVRVWDPRIADKAAMVFKHSAAVESVLPMHEGTTLLAAAGNQVSVLDLVAARPREMLRNHQKTVTSLALASKGTRILTGALDGHVKVFDTKSWDVIAGFKYPSPILSLSVVSSGGNQEDKHLVVGLQSGLLSVRSRQSGQQKTAAKKRQKEMQALVEGKIEEYDRKQKKRARGRGWEKATRGKDYTGEGADIVIDGNSRGKLVGSRRIKWQHALFKGRYEDALDIVLAPENKNHATNANVLTLLTALHHRSALRVALSNRDEQTLQPILKWVTKHIGDPRITKITTRTATELLDIYSEHLGTSHEIDMLFKRLYDQVRNNAEIAQVCWNTRGMLQMLCGGNTGT
ncbi:putative small nucleolar ribonucleoprotein complex subunit Utp15 [Patellaria atrata CBS 101060]|uniref:Small nucleolar ribonucleoprotein complex subunit Utp15 n=1 Tax=Patellaria atrata CBS 101060 TaxID=1346257 RepID=A0A9P4VQP3_9PEZI|nr:putative small nucleolar ribonucleoprotein complex subunit Utp15 [Patellaria atrata CBS 101060]